MTVCGNCQKPVGDDGEGVTRDIRGRLICRACGSIVPEAKPWNGKPFFAPTRVPRKFVTEAGWRCEEPGCGRRETEGGAGYEGAVQQARRHSESTGHVVVAWTYRLQRIVDGREVRT